MQLDLIINFGLINNNFVNIQNLDQFHFHINKLVIVLIFNKSLIVDKTRIN